MDGILALVRAGFSEEDILNMTIDKFNLYLNALGRGVTQSRRTSVMDMAGAIAGIFAKDGIEKYLEQLTDNGE